MIHEELRDLHMQLGVFADRVSATDWDILRLVRRNMLALAERVEALEGGVAPALPKKKAQTVPAA